ncbi:hypothetical protein [Plantactinospora sp. KBS50]|uniref:hypothetical protein n=1 Tax=Plantactinospora sp. KBS50 TaxID=2024580 RepID=UPI0012FE504A|nr:hypothetical protein [Plantactinospora sp. KBS50]
MPRRGRSTTVGKFAKRHQDQRVSEIRVLGDLLRRERTDGAHPDVPVAPVARPLPA